MARSLTLSGASSAFAATPTCCANSDRRVKEWDRARARKLLACGFRGQSFSPNLNLHPKLLRLRRSYGATAFLLLPSAPHVAAPLVISIDSAPTPAGDVLEGRKTPKKKSRSRRRSKSAIPQQSEVGEEFASTSGRESIFAGELQARAGRLPSKLSLTSQILDIDGKLPETNQKKEAAGDLAHLCWQSGDPLGKRVLGKAVVNWISKGLQQLACEIAQAEEHGQAASIAEKMSESGLAFVSFVQPYLAGNPLPIHSEALCLKASTHYPTLFDHFQRELQAALQDLQNGEAIKDWKQSEAWKLLKRHARSDEHRAVTRKTPEQRGIQEELGLSREKVATIQRKIDAFVAQAFELLRVERDAELDATQNSLNSAPEESMALSEDARLQEQLLHEDDLHAECCDTLRNLTAINCSTGLGGMQLVTFSGKSGTRLPPTGLSPGDMVCVRISNKKGGGATECMRGSIYSLGEDFTSISVAVEARYGDPLFSRLFGRTLRIDRISDLADATTYQRDCQALERLQKHGLQKKSVAAPVVATLFGEGADIAWLAQHGPPNSWKSFSSREGPSPETETEVGSDLDFDEYQRNAIDLGLSTDRPVVVIQGPPGTGKTKVLGEIIRNVVWSGERVLATAPTNAAVDNLVEKLADIGLNVVRIGNPARVAPAVAAKSLSHVIDSKLEIFRRDLARRRADLRNDLRQCLGDESMEAGLRRMLKQLGRSLKQKEKELVDETIRQADVILCTNTGAGDNFVRQIRHFGLVVIDEAGQAIEPSCWIPLLQGRRAILAGDTRQLAPTILSREAMEGGLGVSLMERASELHGGILSCMLQTQYRMNDVIANWSSTEMYSGLVKSGPTVSAHLLADNAGVRKELWLTQVPFLLLDTRLAHGSLIAGCEEHMDPAGTGSYYNEGEADIVVGHVRVLLSAGVAPETIAVQSPYVAQVQLLRSRVDDLPGGQSVQVASVDSFQGREADAVIISMVRSNRLGVVGFLGDNRRMNVAITRARKHVAIVCDSTTVGRNAFLKRLLLYIKQHGEVRCAFEGWSISGLLKGRLPTSGPS